MWVNEDEKDKIWNSVEFGHDFFLQPSHTLILGLKNRLNLRLFFFGSKYYLCEQNTKCLKSDSRFD